MKAITLLLTFVYLQFYYAKGHSIYPIYFQSQNFTCCLTNACNVTVTNCTEIVKPACCTTSNCTSPDEQPLCSYDCCRHLTCNTTSIDKCPEDE